MRLTTDMRGELKHQKGKTMRTMMMLELKELHVSFCNVALPGHTEGRGAT